ncbi:histidine kinase [Nocardioides sp. Root190]|uniref:sensor histidine kinase n=1 Tax=Nocardioides sp. Root190 TaxID=1736488 RepID=UPI0006F5AA34|nr:histidine kinase [Nocardioides sp. Root190]KRB77052.1 histidine kinase [Nocardioides sp. Root190]
MESPDDHQPPLRWWSHLWRYLLATAIGLVVWLPVVEAQAEERPLLFWLDIVLGVAVGVLVLWRRRWPMTIAVIAVLATPFSSLAAGPITLATVSLATRRSWWQVVTIGALSLLGTWAYYELQPVTDSEPTWLISLFSVLAVSATLGWGLYIGSRRELLWTLRQRAETAEAERDLRATQARSNERARIAREMHDVLAHRISQISMHAGALTFREDLSAEEMRSSAAVIQTKAHEALTDLREVLGVLRDDLGGGPLTGPQPTYCDVLELIEDARNAGTTIEYDDRLAEGEPPPAGVGRTMFRIVQEGITNASKHAPAAALSIRLSGDAEAGIELMLRNAVGFGPTRTPGSGLGLVGLSERAELRGGTLAHGVEAASPDGQRPATFVLRAWLPWSGD